MVKQDCEICGKKIETMSFRGTGVCGENHRKIRDGEISPSRAQVDAGVTGILRQPEGEVNLREIS